MKKELSALSAVFLLVSCHSRAFNESGTTSGVETNSALSECPAGKHWEYNSGWWCVEPNERESCPKSMGWAKVSGKWECISRTTAELSGCVMAFKSKTGASEENNKRLFMGGPFQNLVKSGVESGKQKLTVSRGGKQYDIAAEYTFQRKEVGVASNKDPVFSYEMSYRLTVNGLSASSPSFAFINRHNYGEHIVVPTSTGLEWHPLGSSEAKAKAENSEFFVFTFCGPYHLEMRKREDTDYFESEQG